MDLLYSNSKTNLRIIAQVELEYNVEIKLEQLVDARQVGLGCSRCTVESHIDAEFGT